MRMTPTMKSLLSALLLVTLATSALGQESPSVAPTPPPTPDFSRDNLTRILSYTEVEAERPRNIEFGWGYIDFRLLGIRVKFSPIFAPLPGSVPHQTKEFPDPFALTGASIATTPENFRRGREVSSELRKIEKRIRETSTVKVEP